MCIWIDPKIINCENCPSLLCPDAPLDTEENPFCDFHGRDLCPICMREDCSCGFKTTGVCKIEPGPLFDGRIDDG